MPPAVISIWYFRSMSGDTSMVIVRSAGPRRCETSSPASHKMTKAEQSRTQLLVVLFTVGTRSFTSNDRRRCCSIGREMGSI